jgi:hypothetical protein
MPNYDFIHNALDMLELLPPGPTKCSVCQDRPVAFTGRFICFYCNAIAGHELSDEDRERHRGRLTLCPESGALSLAEGGQLSGVGT